MRSSAWDLDPTNRPMFDPMICSQVHHARIDSEGISLFIGNWRGNFKGYSQGEDVFVVDEVCFPFDSVHPSGLVAAYHEWDKHAFSQRQERDAQQTSNEAN